jgi:hypothetical protein
MMPEIGRRKNVGDKTPTVQGCLASRRRLVKRGVEGPLFAASLAGLGRECRFGFPECGHCRIDDAAKNRMAAKAELLPDGIPMSDSFAISKRPK